MKYKFKNEGILSKINENLSSKEITNNPTELVISKSIKSKDDFYDEISRLLKLKEWFGRNLDAFADVLRGGCGEIDPNGKIFIWKGHKSAKNELGSRTFETIIRIFQEEEHEIRLE